MTVNTVSHLLLLHGSRFEFGRERVACEVRTDQLKYSTILDMTNVFGPETFSGLSRKARQITDLKIPSEMYTINPSEAGSSDLLKTTAMSWMAKQQLYFSADHRDRNISSKFSRSTNARS